MQLYLSSYRLGDRTSELARIVGADCKAAVITNAGDFYAGHEVGSAKTIMRAAREVEDLGRLGIEADILDLRDWFGKNDIARHLGQYRMVWVLGGNVFALRYAMSKSGADAAIQTLAADNRLVYAGYSAGACVTGPDLRAFAQMDDPQAVQVLYGAEPVWEGLGLVPYLIVPHYHSDHPEAAAASVLASNLAAAGTPFVALKDGEVILVSTD